MGGYHTNPNILRNPNFRVECFEFCVSTQNGGNYLNFAIFFCNPRVQNTTAPFHCNQMNVP